MVSLSRSALLPLLFGSLFLSSLTSAQSVVPVKQTSMIQSDGPKKGKSADRYFNVEGKSHDKYMNYGVLRFETKALKAELDKKYGAGKYKITAVTLQLTQSNAAFTQDGTVLFFFTPDAKTEIKEASSPLKYPYNPNGAPLHGLSLGKITFNKAGEKTDPSKPHATGYPLLKGDPGQNALVAALTQGQTVTLVLAEGDPNVAATWSAKSAALNVTAAKK